MDEGVDFLVLEFFEATLFDRLEDQGPMPEGTADNILNQLICAVDAITSAGFSHLDIKVIISQV